MIVLKNVPMPEYDDDLKPVLLTDETINNRKKALLCKMQTEGFDALVIYADLEHGSNFEYLTGFLPRFEEALLVLHKDGKAFLVLGNENLNKAGKARIEASPVHMPHFSLPNQPMNTKKSTAEILAETGIVNAEKIGMIGWKNFTSKNEDNSTIFDIPYYIVSAVKDICKKAVIINAAFLFIGEGGVRTVNNANELAHYEFGAALAGNCVIAALEELDEGKTEMEIASKLGAFGQPHSVVTVMAAGERFVKANVYPTAKKICRGDRISITTGFKGGLQSRGGYAVATENELPEKEKDYLERVAKPYYNAVKTWIENIRIGMEGSELYNIIESILPKEKYGWSLNPGHLCADEEWMASPIYQGSAEVLKSGMLLQIDIIPSVSGYSGISCESGVALADSALRKEIECEYPQMWERIAKRRDYIKNVLGIDIPEEVLPMANATAFCRPFMLDKKSAFVCE